MARIGPFILLVLLAVGAYSYFRTRDQAHDPYAACDKLKTEKERGICRAQVDFAMSAGM